MPRWLLIELDLDLDSVPSSLYPFKSMGCIRCNCKIKEQFCTSNFAVIKSLESRYLLDVLKWAVLTQSWRGLCTADSPDTHSFWVSSVVLVSMMEQYMETESLNPISNVKRHLANILLFFVDTLLALWESFKFCAFEHSFWVIWGCNLLPSHHKTILWVHQLDEFVILITFSNIRLLLNLWQI